jgi:hypothetical protein
MPITPVSEAAHWAAMHRTFESARADTLSDDPHPRRMAGALRGTIVHEVPHGKTMARACFVRNAAMDDWTSPIEGSLVKGREVVVVGGGHPAGQAGCSWPFKSRMCT